jgi:hypothetical protein
LKDATQQTIKQLLDTTLNVSEAEDLEYCLHDDIEAIAGCLRGVSPQKFKSKFCSVSK